MHATLTWSGSSSKEVAIFFREWLPVVLPGIEPWVSSEDIAKGSEWFPELMEQLDRSWISLTFITPENVRSPWIYYEVGVIAAKLKGRDIDRRPIDGGTDKRERALVCPYLVGVESRHVKDTPLGRFQWTDASREDTWRLIVSINKTLGEGRHNEQILEGNFNAQWPKLKHQLDKVIETLGEVEDDVTEVEPSIEEQLSKEARHLLSESMKDPHGVVIFYRDSGGMTLQTNNKDMIPERTPRNEATWKAALEELEGFGLVVPMSYNREMFEVTKKGYDVADRISSRV